MTQRPSVAPPWSSSRTSQVSLLDSLSDLDANIRSEISDQNYQDWVSRSRTRSSSLRRTLAHRIGASASGSWPTSRAEDSESCGNHGAASDSLNATVANWKTPTRWDAMSPTDQLGGQSETSTWPTPQSRDLKGQRGEHTQGGRDLSQESETWSTPTVRCEKGGGNATKRADGKSRLDMLDWQAEAFSRPVLSAIDGRELSPTHRTLRPRLNPAFAAWLMGLPGWWTSTAVTSSARSAMVEYRVALRSHLARLLSA